MTGLTLAFAALLGLAVGSFLNVVIHRVPRGESVTRPPSSCPSCGTQIRPQDNIPVLSYILLRGKCRKCRAPISLRYPLVEFTTAALAVAAFVRFEAVEEAALVALSSAVLLALTMIDLEHRRLPNVIVLPSTAAAILWIGGLALAKDSLDVAAMAVACGVGAFVLLFVIALVSGGMGFGDVKLAAFIGVVTGRFGWPVTVGAIFGAFLLGGIIAIVLLLARRATRKQAIPFGPSMAAGAIIATFAGPGPVEAWLGL